MNPYRDMYNLLFNCVTDIIATLQAAQQECEAIFMENNPKDTPALTVLDLTDSPGQQEDTEKPPSP